MRALAVSHIWKKLFVAAVKAQSYSLMGRLNSIGPGAVLAAGRRRKAYKQERLLAIEGRVVALESKARM